jgi:ribonuclease BN (tRNA processing enzyme)
MALRFSTLASGSKGNSSIVELDGKYLMVDIGLSAKSLKGRLSQIGLSIKHVTDVLLTHTHGDHVNDTALSLLAEQGIWFWCHPEHQEYLAQRPGFQSLKYSGLVLTYDECKFQTISGLTVYPAALRHGPGKTFGFRIEHTLKVENERSAIAYFADIGCWNRATVDHFANCNLLAMEFNHDVKMTLASPRHPSVIKRNLSDDGHLSNDQAAGLLQQILNASLICKPKNLVLLHISDQCNTHEMAVNAATRVLSQTGLEYISIRAAEQSQASGWLDVPFVNSICTEIRTEISTQTLPALKSVRKKNKVSPFQQEFFFPV